MAQVTNFQQKQFSLHDLIPKIQRKGPEFILVEEAKCTKILPGVKCSPKGDSYKIGLFETDQKQTGSFLVCQKVWNLDLVEHLAQQKVRFLITENGLQLKRIQEQPFLTQQHITEAVGEDELKVKKKENTTEEIKPEEEEEKRINTSVEVIEKIAGALTQKAADSGLAVALGIYIPPNLFSKNKPK